MSAVSIAIEPPKTLRSDSNVIWQALVSATATWAEIVPEYFDDIDWAKLILDAEYHGVLPIVARRVLESRLAQAIPLKIKEQLRHSVEASLARGLPLLAEVQRIARAFRAGDVLVIPYKGPVMAEQLWGDAALRECADLDFLIEKKNVDRAGDILDQMGYSQLAPVARHLRPALVKNASEEQFKHRESGLLLELQWSPAPRVFALRFDGGRLWQRTREISCGGELMPAPSPEYLLMLLSIHGWKHNWGRLIWLGDIAQLLRTSQIDWHVVFETCRRDRNLRLLSLALHMSHRVFDTLIPEPFAFRDSALDELVNELVERLRDVQPCGYRDWHRCMLLARDGRWDQMRQLATFFFTPGLADYATCSLPAWASVGYRLIRVGRLLKHPRQK